MLRDTMQGEGLYAEQSRSHCHSDAHQLTGEYDQGLRSVSSVDLITLENTDVTDSY